MKQPGGWVQEFAQQGLLKPLDDYVARDGAAMGYPDDWQAFSVSRNMVEGSYYGVQIHLTCATLVYNVDLLKEAGYETPPKTWEEFREVAIATTKAGRFGFAPNPVTSYYWPWLFQAGAEYYDPQANKVTFDSPAAAKALLDGDTLYRRLAAAGIASTVLQPAAFSPSTHRCGWPTSTRPCELTPLARRKTRP